MFVLVKGVNCFRFALVVLGLGAVEANPLPKPLDQLYIPFPARPPILPSVPIVGSKAATAGTAPQITVISVVNTPCLYF